MKKERKACRVLTGPPEGKRELGKHMCRWEGNIKIDLKNITYEGMDWIHLILE
jgi:hypothetical protein